MTEGLYPWVQIRLVARTGTGHTPSRKREELWHPDECTIPWITLADVGRLRSGVVTVVNETAECISEAGIRESAAVLHPAGTVCLSRTASVGFSAVMGRSMAVSQDFMTWTPGPQLDSMFLLFVLRALRPRLLGLMHGSTHQTIYMPDLRALRTPLPPAQVQIRIAEFLLRENARIASVLTVVDNLHAALSAQRREIFDRLTVDAPRVRARFRLGRIEQGWSPQCEAGEADEGEWGVLKVGAVNFGRFRWTEHKRLPDELDPRPQYEVQPGDLIMSRANTRELVGSAALVEHTAGRRLMLCDKTYRLVPNEQIQPGFLALALGSRSCRDQLQVAATGASSSMQNISQETVRSLRIPDLSPDQQVVVEREAQGRYRSLDALQGKLHVTRERLLEYRNALATDAVTGQLDLTVMSETQMEERLVAATEGRLEETV